MDQAAMMQAVIGSTVVKSLEAAEAQLDAEIEALDKMGEDDIEACARARARGAHATHGNTVVRRARGVARAGFGGAG